MTSHESKRKLTVNLLDCLNTGENNIEHTPLTFGKLALNNPSNANNQSAMSTLPQKIWKNQVSALGHNNLRVKTAVTLDSSTANRHVHVPNPHGHF